MSCGEKLSSAILGLGFCMTFNMHMVCDCTWSAMTKCQVQAAASFLYSTTAVGFVQLPFEMHTTGHVSLAGRLG